MDSKLNVFENWASPFGTDIWAHWRKLVQNKDAKRCKISVKKHIVPKIAEAAELAVPDQKYVVDKYGDYELYLLKTTDGEIMLARKKDTFAHPYAKVQTSIATFSQGLAKVVSSIESIEKKMTEEAKSNGRHNDRIDRDQAGSSSHSSHSTQNGHATRARNKKVKKQQQKEQPEQDWLVIDSDSE